MKDPATGRAALNGEWAKMFPDPASRPARHTLALGANNPNHVTCDFTAVIGGCLSSPALGAERGVMVYRDTCRPARSGKRNVRES